MGHGIKGHGLFFDPKGGGCGPSPGPMFIRESDFELVVICGTTMAVVGDGSERGRRDDEDDDNDDDDDDHDME